MKLYYTAGACSLGAHIALEWSGADYQAEAVPFSGPRLKEIYPEGNGKVPILDRENGLPMLTQTPAIIRYIADRFPAANIGSSDSVDDQAELNRWIVFLCADLHPAFHPVFVGGRYTTDDSQSAVECVEEAARGMVRKELQVLDKHLQGRTYIIGDSATIADAYAFPMLRWAMDKLPEQLNDMPNLQRLHDVLASDSAVKSVLKDEGIDT